ncbi:MAG: transcriptional regulator FtrA [bacterium]|nr:transcriptional regulator FtrA [bacterium]
MADTHSHSTVVALVYDGLCTFEFGCAYEIFGLPRPELDRPWYRFEACAVEPGPLRAAGGFTIQAPCNLHLIDEADTVIVPGWKNPDAPASPLLLAALRRVVERGGRLASICSGAFLLAAAGVLDGRRVTTHWRYADALARRFPRTDVDPNVLYVDEGPVLTSAGSAAGLDLCLHMVRCDHGTAIANNVARRLVLAPHREGGQAQFVERPVAADAKAARFNRLLEWLPARLDEDLRVADLARQAGMSVRSFQRRFREATGSPPGEWLIQQRVDRARHLAETTALTIEEIAARSGLGAAETLRHHFRRLLGTTPTAYRRTFARIGRPR